MPLLLLIPAVIVALGYGADKAGEGMNDAGSGALKLALAAGVGYYLYRRIK